MNSCPKCNRDVWLYDANTWTCKAGHHTAIGHDPFTPAWHVNWPWLALGAVAGDLIGHLLWALL